MTRHSTPATTTAIVPDWRSRAACIGEDPELWFPPGHTGESLRQAEAAKTICRRCDVREACLAWALDNDAWGIWGGTTQAERDAMTRRRRRGRRR
ncbi:MAG: WhiB family transcriptional regulator [Nitriliruptorales bacterium]|nr:WhiB family transcriptional regulator [Nitriliruptorales bacterium]